VHTSAKARFTSVAIRIRIWIRIRIRIGIRIRIQIRIHESDRHQNLIFCSVDHCQPSLKILCKSVQTFLRKVANRETDRETDRQRRLHILLGGGKKCQSIGTQLCKLQHSTETRQTIYEHRVIPVQLQFSSCARIVDRRAGQQTVNTSLIADD